MQIGFHMPLSEFPNARGRSTSLNRLRLSLRGQVPRALAGIGRVTLALDPVPRVTPSADQVPRRLRDRVPPGTD